MSKVVCESPEGGAEDGRSIQNVFQGNDGWAEREKKVDTRMPDAFKNAFHGKDGRVEREMPRKNKPRKIVGDEMC